MIIQSVTAYPLSCAVPPQFQVSLGIGRTIKRDTVLVRVADEAGLAGWGEAHAARAPTVIAELINSTLGPLVRGLEVEDSAALWTKVYRAQLASHGTGAAAAIALSGIDLACWDLRGRHAQVPVWRLLGGTARAIPAYAGGISLGYQPLAALVLEALGLVAHGYRALKLRIGQRVVDDLARITAVREAVGLSVELMVDANCAYTVADVRAIMDGLVRQRVAWLEEPFPAHAQRDYLALKDLGGVPIAAGENHYTRFDFERLQDDGVVSIWQPDLSKTGGLSEALHIARLAAQAGIALCPHTSVTGLNIGATLNFLSSIPNAGYFEADCAAFNPLRTELTSPRAELAPDGTFSTPRGAGLGAAVSEALFARFPVIAGAGYLPRSE